MRLAVCHKFTALNRSELCVSKGSLNACGATVAIIQSIMYLQYLAARDIGMQPLKTDGLSPCILLVSSDQV